MAQATPLLARAQVEALTRVWGFSSRPLASWDRWEIVGTACSSFRAPGPWGPGVRNSDSRLAHSAKASLLSRAQDSRQVSIMSAAFQSRAFSLDQVPFSTRRIVAMAWKWGFFPSRWWAFQSTTMPRFTSS